MPVCDWGFGAYPSRAVSPHPLTRQPSAILYCIELNICFHYAFVCVFEIGVASSDLVFSGVGVVGEVDFRSPHFRGESIPFNPDLVFHRKLLQWDTIWVVTIISSHRVVFRCKHRLRVHLQLWAISYSITTIAGPCKAGSS